MINDHFHAVFSEIEWLLNACSLNLQTCIVYTRGNQQLNHHIFNFCPESVHNIHQALYRSLKFSLDVTIKCSWYVCLSLSSLYQSVLMSILCTMIHLYMGVFCDDKFFFVYHNSLRVYGASGLQWIWLRLIGGIDKRILKLFIQYMASQDSISFSYLFPQKFTPLETSWWEPGHSHHNISSGIGRYHPVLCS